MTPRADLPIQCSRRWVSPRLLFRLWTLCLCLAACPSIWSQTPGTVLWTFDTGDVIQSSPALAPDGTIYFGSHDRKLYALNPDGSKKWEFPTSGNIPSSPVVAKDGTIYIASLDKMLYALTPEGRIKWLIAPGSAIAATPALGAGGDIYVATAFNRLCAIHPAGSKKWDFNTGGNLVSSPLVNGDGLICFGCQDGKLYAVNAQGSVQWTFTAGDKINSSPALGADQTIYAGAFDGKLHAIHPDGSGKWDYQTGSAIRSSPAIGLGGEIYVGSDDGKLHAVSPEGNVRWTFPTGGEVRSSPAVGADGVIYFGSYDNTFHAVSANGKGRWKLATEGSITASPVIDANGVVYIGSWDKKLYAIKCSSLGLAQTAWPMFRGDAQHAGQVADKQTGASRLQLTHLDARIQLTEPAIIRLFADAGADATSIEQVAFFLGTNQVALATSPPFALIQTNISAGVHSYRARAKFLSGETAQSPAVSITVRSAAAPSPAPPTSVQRPSPSPAMATTGTKPPQTEPPVKPEARPDTERPTVEIASPSGRRKAETRESHIALRGSATDNAGVAKVEIRVGAKPPQAAEGTTRWTATVPLEPGENVITAVAIDAAGNRSAIEERRVGYRPLATLSIAVEGAGSVSPALDGREIEVGERVRLVAEPAAGHDFAGWRGSVEVPNPDITFSMKEGVKLIAVFTPRPPTSGAGVYNGIVHSTSIISHDSIGFITIEVDEAGSFQGELLLAGRAFALRGTFDKSGSATLRIPRGQDNPLNVSLKLDFKNKPNVLTGTVSNGPTISDILADRQVYDGKSRVAPQAGRYTLTISGEARDAAEFFGEGFGALTVDQDGLIRFEGRLGDGEAIEQKAHISSAGVWSFYIPLYQNRGCVVGWIRFKDQPFGDLFGQLTWIRPPGSPDKKLSGGFTAELTVLGSRYTPPGRGKPILTSSSGVLALRGDGFGDKTFINSISIDSNNRVVFPNPTPLKCKLRFAPSTGLFSGSFVHPANGKTTAIQGALLQKQRSGAGFFQGPDRTGPVVIGPDAAAQATPAP